MYHKHRYNELCDINISKYPILIYHQILRIFDTILLINVNMVGPATFP